MSDVTPTRVLTRKQIVVIAICTVYILLMFKPCMTGHSEMGPNWLAWQVQRGQTIMHQGPNGELPNSCTPSFWTGAVNCQYSNPGSYNKVISQEVVNGKIRYCAWEAENPDRKVCQKMEG